MHAKSLITCYGNWFFGFLAVDCIPVTCIYCIFCVVVNFFMYFYVYCVLLVRFHIIKIISELWQFNSFQYGGHITWAVVVADCSCCHMLMVEAAPSLMWCNVVSCHENNSGQVWIAWKVFAQVPVTNGGFGGACNVVIMLTVKINCAEWVFRSQKLRSITDAMLLLSLIFMNRCYWLL